MKVGVLTYHRARNYGAFLQAYALCKRLNEEKEIEAEVIDFQMKKEINRYAGKITKSAIRHPVRFWHDRIDGKNQEKLFEESLKEQILSEYYFSTDSLNEFNEYIRGKYDAVIVGSDEVWKTNGFRGFPNPYWLIGDIGCPKLSYAASARNDFGVLSPSNQKIIEKTLRGYEFIGVRDLLTFKEVKRFCSTDQEVYLCCDPTLLYDFIPNKENGRKILKERFGVDVTKSLIGVMTEDRTVSRKIRKKLDRNNFELIALYQWQPDCINASLLSPFEWLDVISSLDLLITSFFHAVIFASKFGIPMISFGTKDKAAKVKEVINVVGRKEDYYSDFNDVLKQQDVGDFIKDKINDPQRSFVPDEDQLNGYKELVIKLRQLGKIYK